MPCASRACVERRREPADGERHAGPPAAPRRRPTPPRSSWPSGALVGGERVAACSGPAARRGRSGSRPGRAGRRRSPCRARATFTSMPRSSSDRMSALAWCARTGRPSVEGAARTASSARWSAGIQRDRRPRPGSSTTASPSERGCGPRHRSTPRPGRARRGRPSSAALSAGLARCRHLGLEHLPAAHRRQPRPGWRAPRSGGRTASGTRGSRRARLTSPTSGGPQCRPSRSSSTGASRRSTITSAFRRTLRPRARPARPAAWASARRGGRRCRRARRRW